MERTFFALGAASGFLSVAAGAFGAHALRAQLGPELLAVFETGARYQLFHALALLATGAAAARWPCRAVGVAGWLFVAGTVLFSGSLYLLTLTGIRRWGMVTPMGGLAWLGAWVALAWAALRG